MCAVASGPPKSKLKGTTKDAEFMEVSKDHSSSKHNKDDEQDNDSTGSSVGTKCVLAHTLKF
jgi:hypothetical protein